MDDGKKWLEGYCLKVGDKVKVTCIPPEMECYVDKGVMRNAYEACIGKIYKIEKVSVAGLSLKEHHGEDYVICLTPRDGRKQARWLVMALEKVVEEEYEYKRKSLLNWRKQDDSKT